MSFPIMSFRSLLEMKEELRRDRNRSALLSAITLTSGVGVIALSGGTALWGGLGFVVAGTLQGVSSYLDQRRLRDVLAAEKLIETHASEYEIDVALSKAFRTRPPRSKNDDSLAFDVKPSGRQLGVSHEEIEEVSEILSDENTDISDKRRDVISKEVVATPVVVSSSRPQRPGGR